MTISTVNRVFSAPEKRKVRRNLGNFLLAVLLSPIGAMVSAAEIVKIGPTKGFVAVSQDKPDQWDINDYVCLVSEGRAIACGDVIRAAEKGLQVNVTAQNQSLRVGQKVEISKMKTAPSGRSETLELIQSVPEPVYDQKNVSAGITLGTFVVHFSQALNENLAFGLMMNSGSQGAGDGSLSVFGLSGTVSYHSGGPFRTGVWATGGLGIHLLTATLQGQNEKTGSVFAYGAGGYRYSFESGLNVGGAFGLQYFFNRNLTSNFDLKFSGISPNLFLEIGYTF